MLLPSLCGLSLLLQLTTSATVDVYTGYVLHRVNEKFISITMDQFLLGMKPKWSTFDFSSPRVQTQLRGLSPAFLRFGGSPADYSMFTEADPAFLATLNDLPIYQSYSKKDLDGLVEVTNASGLHLLFELNMQLREGNQYDPTNVITILDYFQEKGYGANVDFEMGNEPDVYGTKGLVALSGTRMGKDYLMLRKILDHYPSVHDSVLVGPDVVTQGATAINIFKDFINEAGNVLEAATFHHYYFHGPSASLSDYINPKNFQNLVDTINTFRNAAMGSKYPTIPLWIGETSDSWGGGSHEVSNRFVSGFLWLDKLGLSAKMGIDVVMRQTFYGGNYSLIAEDLSPNPDYWLTYIHNQLVGIEVLETQVTPDTLYWPGPRAGDNSSDYLRVYTHCTKPSTQYKKGAVTVFAINFKNDTSETLHFSGQLSMQQVDVYMLTPGDADGLLSHFVNLNGDRLEMKSDTEMAPLVPNVQQASAGIVIPPLSFGFYVFPNANIYVCQN